MSANQAEAPVKERVDLSLFVGAWHLVSWAEATGDGTKTYPYGEQARGQILYTPSGQMSAQLMRPGADLSRFAGLDGAAALRELGRTTFFAYWGTYEVDADAETVTHHIEGCLVPSWVGTAQVRGYRFENEDRLILTPRPAGAQQAAPELKASKLTWKRVR